MGPMALLRMNSKEMDIVFHLIARSRNSILMAVITGIASGLGSAALIGLINTELHSTAVDFNLTLWLFAALGTLVIITQIFSTMVIMRAGQAAARDLRMELSQRILNAPFRLLQQLGAPRLMANLTEDVTVLIEAFQSIPQMCIHTSWVAGCLMYLAWLSWSLLLTVIVVMLLGVVVYQLIIRRAMKPLHSAREEHDALYAHFRGLVHGIKEIKLHRQRKKAFQEDVLYPTAEACRKQIVIAMTMFILAATFGTALLYCLIGFILFGTSSWQGITAEIVSGYTLTLLYMMAPLTAALGDLPAFGRASVALGKIEQLKKELSDQAEIPAAANYFNIDVSLGNLEFLAVTHQYRREGDEHPFTLGPLNVTFQPGEMVFIIGGNGSGKSTLSLLLVGLYSPESGRIRLNGVDITEAEREYYRQQFAVVFADFYLFESLLGLMADNLDHKARTYLAELQLDHKVNVANGVFSTVELSQGQRKRLALVTAYLEDRPFYVFDEWAADQDPIFKELFYTVILRDLKARGKTVVVITHDDHYFHLADRCIRLENGQIVEDSSLKSEFPCHVRGMKQMALFQNSRQYS